MQRTAASIEDGELTMQGNPDQEMTHKVCRDQPKTGEPDRGVDDSGQDLVKRTAGKDVGLQQAAVSSNEDMKRDSRNDSSERKGPAAPPLQAALSSLFGNPTLPLQGWRLLISDCRQFKQGWKGKARSGISAKTPRKDSDQQPPPL